jgi:hypothetical protein
MSQESGTRTVLNWALPGLLGGLVFALRLQGIVAVLGGMVYGVIVYVAMYWVLLRAMLSSTSASFLSANPEWSWVAAHLMFGVVLGALAAYGPLRILYGRTARRQIA